MVWLMPLQTGNKRKEPVREREREGKGNERGRQRKWNEWGSRLERHQAMVQWYELLADDHLADFYFLQWETGKVTLLLLGTGLFFPATHAIQIQPLKSQMQCMQCVRAGICSEVMVPGKVRGERRRGGAGSGVRVPPHVRREGKRADKSYCSMGSTFTLSVCLPLLLCLTVTHRQVWSWERCATSPR